MNLKHLKKLLLVGILTAFHASADNPETGLQTVAPNAITTVCNNVSGQTDGLNWQSFIFDCTATGDFYVNFWLNPARHEDNTLFCK